MLTIELKINGKVIRHIEVVNRGKPLPEENWHKDARVYDVHSGWQDFTIIHQRKEDGAYELVRQVLAGIKPEPRFVDLSKKISNEKGGLDG